MTGALTHWMEVALWVVLGSMAADFLIWLFKSLTSNKLSSEPVLGYLKDVVLYVVPLLVLAMISTMDQTGWIVQVGYYVGAVAVVVHYLQSIRSKF